MKLWCLFLTFTGIVLPSPLLAAVNNQYVSYSFSASPDKNDVYFPTFTLYTSDFIADPDPGAFTSQRFYSATELAESSNVASVLFEWGGTPCCGITTRSPYVTIFQRFAYPGQNRFGGRVQTIQTGERGNGAFVWKVALIDGPMPITNPIITPLQAYNGAWETPVGSTIQNEPIAPPPPPGPGVPPPAVPEPDVWALLIIGFGLVGARLRRREVGTPALTA